MGGTLLAPVGHTVSSGSAWPLQMAPDFTGSPFRAPATSAQEQGAPEGRDTVRYKATSWFGSDLSDVVVGGGLVQTFAFGGSAPEEQTGGDSVRVPAPSVPFTLADMIGVSSAAFAGMVSGVAGSISSAFDPSAKIWPVLQEGMRRQEALEYKLGDGSIIEDSGVLAMLQRRAKRIVWFINTDTGIASVSEFDWCKAEHAGLKPDGMVSDQVYDKFGFGADFFRSNQVFAEKELPRVLCALQTSRDDGKPAVAKFSHDVLPNPRWGIVGGWQLDIVYVYNEKISTFVDMLPNDTQGELHKGSNGEFANYPFYRTVFNNDDHAISLTASQVNLLSAQAEFAMRENQAVFEDLLVMKDAWWKWW
mmetsp:Transcript_598/g.2518  ORF Transcript_598/g.2518 Transcript_598/m.2518 type:complete len:362 (+) Transcript_598:218-1303(+)